MKEIDLLPQWYKNDRRRRIGCRTQHILLGGMFAVLICWGLVTACKVSKAKSDLVKIERKQKAAEQDMLGYQTVKSKILELEKKTGVLKNIYDNIEIADVLAEMSWLINDKVVLKGVEIKSEELGAEKKLMVGTIRTVGNGGNNTLLFGDVRYRIVLKGLASDVGGVADLICALEDSAYFFQVIPLFSENRKENNVDTKVASELTEFEIGCFLDNYRELFSQK